RPLDPFRCKLERPGDDERDWESDRDQCDHQPHDPIWNLQEWEDLRSNLDQQPADNRVSDSHLVNVPPLQLPEEILRIHGLAFATLSICEQEQRRQIALSTLPGRVGLCSFA